MKRKVVAEPPAEQVIKVKSIEWRGRPDPCVVLSYGGRDYTLFPGDSLTLPIVVFTA